MNRYTRRLDDGQAVMDCRECPESWMNKAGADCTALFCRNRLKDRVADYEDTGLEPGEIERVVDAYGRGMTLRTEAAERLEIIRKIPTARLRKIVKPDQDEPRGHWIWRGKDKGYECSVCHSCCLLNYERDWHKSDLCPHCGANMREETNNENQT